MLYQIIDGSISVGGEVILSHFDFEIKQNDKIAIVGRNGAGKTTLLRLISNELQLDRDDKRRNQGINISRTATIGFLKQTGEVDKERTVEELLYAACPMKDSYAIERYQYEMEYDKLFTRFGFKKEDKSKKLLEFSGGEQTKISLIQLLLEQPDILLLDEPTNHLDMQTVEWLEDYLKAYSGAVVIVSHDRFFIDRVVKVVYELSDKSLKRYSGNYSEYRKAKLKEYDLLKKAYKRQQDELKRLNDLIDKFKHKPSKASFARSRKSIIERTELIPKPKEDEAHIFTGDILPKVPGSKWVYEADKLKLGYNDRLLLELSLRIRRGQKIGIIGENGIGKTTLIKTIAGIIPSLGGSGLLGNNILLGYFDQHSAEIEDEKTVYEHFSELFPALTQKEVRNTLAAYLFSGSDCFKRVKDLSGGEKSRLFLAELIVSGPNFLVLDEPTNHMDISAKETFESAFRAYKGTLLFVSHDRYFVSQVAQSLLVITEDGVMYYPFGYEHYLSRKDLEEGESLSAMIQAKDLAMIESLKAVPKPEKHRLKELSTNEAYVDWRLRLASEPLKTAKATFEGLYYEFWEYLGDEKVEEALNKWTEECIKWYDEYLLVVGEDIDHKV